METKDAYKTKEVDEETDETIIITVRCIDMASPRSDSDKIKCDMCGEMTWISHSWKSWKGKKIDKVICEKCFYNSEQFKNNKFGAGITSENLQEYVDWAREYYNIPSFITDKEIKDDILRKFGKKIGKKINIM